VVKLMLDLCCIKRLFDAPAEARVRLEAEAVGLVLAAHDVHRARVIATPGLVAENPNEERRQRAREVLARLEWFEPARGPLEQRVGELAGLGFRGFDAVHLASAELAGAGHLLSTDDRLLRNAARRASRLRLEVSDPVRFAEEGLP
jgi:predicted nucleic acid-binding protein